MEHLETLLPVIDITLDDETRDACDKPVPPGCFGADGRMRGWWRALDNYMITSRLREESMYWPKEEIHV
jgi:hypothetical protein